MLGIVEDDDRVFQITEALEFYSSSFEGSPTFIWSDPEGGPNEFYEFVAVGANEPTAAFFETSTLKAVYENKYHKTSEGASDSALRAIAYRHAFSFILFYE